MTLLRHGLVLSSAHPEELYDVCMQFLCICCPQSSAFTFKKGNNRDASPATRACPCMGPSVLYLSASVVRLKIIGHWLLACVLGQQNLHKQELGISRWLAVGKTPAAGGVGGVTQAADFGELQPSTGVELQAAGNGQQQTQQQAAPSGMADPSRWLSEEGYNTLKWQVCGSSHAIC